MSSEIPTIKFKDDKLGDCEMLFGDNFWFRIKDDDGYTLFEMTIPLIFPLNEDQRELILRLAIAKFKLCETQK